MSTSFYPKKKHCYIHGNSNIGKTFFVNLVTSCLFNRVFRVKSTFYFTDLTPDYKIIIWDEFGSWCDKDVNLLKLACGGEFF